MSTAARIKQGKRIIRHGYVSVYSDLLNLTFQCKISDPRAPRLEMQALAHEELARQRARQRAIKPRKPRMAHNV